MTHTQDGVTVTTSDGDIHISVEGKHTITMTQEEFMEIAYKLAEVTHSG